MRSVASTGWGWLGVGWGMVTFLCNCVITFMLRYAWGWVGVGWGMLTFLGNCVITLMLRYAWTCGCCAVASGASSSWKCPCHGKLERFEIDLSANTVDQFTRHAAAVRWCKELAHLVYSKHLVLKSFM